MDNRICLRTVPVHNKRRGEISAQEKKNAEIFHEQAVSDGLLDCLVFLTSYFGKSKSAESVKSGLAYDEAGMNADLFCEAAHRLDIKTKIVKKGSVESIPEQVLPCVLFLSGRNVCVLIKKNGQKALIYSPLDNKKSEIAVKDLQAEYTGYAILTHPDSGFHLKEHKDGKKENADWFWDIVRENKTIFFYVLIASVFINLFVLVSPLFVMNVYDRVIPNNAVETGWALGIGALAAFVFDFLFKTLRGYLIDFAGRKIDVTAAMKIYDKVLDMRLSERPQSGGAFANMLRDFDSVREFFTSATITALVDVPFALVFLFMIFQLAGALALIPIAVIVLVCISGLLIQVTLKNAVFGALKSAESKHGLLVETIAGLETIKANNADGRFRARYAVSVGENARQAQRSRALSALGVNFAMFFQLILSIVMVLTGMTLVQEGVLTVGGLMASVILGGRATAPIGQIANLMTRYHQASGALRTLNSLMQKETDKESGREFLHRPDLKGKIQFDHVSFSYPNTQNPVVRDVSFSIQAGERVGIIGRNGSGKSTLARMMLNLYAPDSGTIRIDDTDYRQIDPADLRRSMAYIAQDITLFSGSIRDNIIISAPRTSESKVLEISKLCGVDEFVARHPMGYDAPVGESGSGLSGGQRQAVALARAMITDPNIFICDEPTNAMDMQAEQAFCKFVKEKIEGKTFILITHKNTMLDLVDRLIVMHNGQIVLDGKREDVLRALDSGSVKVSKG